MKVEGGRRARRKKKVPIGFFQGSVGGCLSIGDSESEEGRRKRVSSGSEAEALTFSGRVGSGELAGLEF